MESGFGDRAAEARCFCVETTGVANAEPARRRYKGCSLSSLKLAAFYVQFVLVQQGYARETKAWYVFCLSVVQFKHLFSSGVWLRRWSHSLFKRDELSCSAVCQNDLLPWKHTLDETDHGRQAN